MDFRPEVSTPPLSFHLFLFLAGRIVQKGREHTMATRLMAVGHGCQV